MSFVAKSEEAYRQGARNVVDQVKRGAQAEAQTLENLAWVNKRLRTTDPTDENYVDDPQQLDELSKMKNNILEELHEGLLAKMKKNILARRHSPALNN
jgi:hypothetical protein